jgi:hypothetical protein
VNPLGERHHSREERCIVRLTSRLVVPLDL